MHLYPYSSEGQFRWHTQVPFLLTLRGVHGVAWVSRLPMRVAPHVEWCGFCVQVKGVEEFKEEEEDGDYTEEEFDSGEISSNFGKI